MAHTGEPSTRNVTVLTEDDQPVFRRAARDLIAATPGFEEVGQAASGPESLEMAAALRPDLVLLDVRMEEMDGIETAERLLASDPEAVVVLISLNEVPEIASAVASGVAPHVRKQELSTQTLLASEQQFPPFFGGRALGGPRGQVISAAGVLILANVFDLTAIAQIGSVVAMAIFLMLGVAALRLRHETHSSAAVVVSAMALTTLVLVLFVVDTLENDPVTVVSTLVITLLAIVLERLWTRVRERTAAAGEAPAPTAAVH